MQSHSRTQRWSYRKLFPLLKSRNTDTMLSLCQPNRDAKNCRFREPECNNCGKLDHIAPIGKLKLVKKFPRSSLANKNPFGAKHQYLNRGQRTNKVTSTNDEQKVPGQLFTIGGTSKPFCADIVVNAKQLPMEIDTGAAVSLIPEQTFRKLYPELSLQPFHAILKICTGECIPVLREA